MQDQHKIKDDEYASLYNILTVISMRIESKYHIENTNPYNKEYSNMFISILISLISYSHITSVNYPECEKLKEQLPVEFHNLNKTPNRQYDVTEFNRIVEEQRVYLGRMERLLSGNETNEFVCTVYSFCRDCISSYKKCVEVFDPFVYDKFFDSMFT